MKRSITFYSIFIAIAVLQAVFYYPRLPEQVASHFDGTGHPDSWARKDFFLAFHIGTVLFIALFFLFIEYVMSQIPDSLINLPNKAYWLAPERRQQTFAFMSSSMLGFGGATAFFIIVIVQLAIHANLSEHPVLSKVVWFWLAAYFVFIFCGLVLLVRRFWKKC